MRSLLCAAVAAAAVLSAVPALPATEASATIPTSPRRDGRGGSSSRERAHRTRRRPARRRPSPRARIKSSRRLIRSKRRNVARVIGECRPDGRAWTESRLRVELPAAFLPAAFQHPATAGRGHARPETDGLFATALVRLECTFWHDGAILPWPGGGVKTNRESSKFPAGRSCRGHAAGPIALR